MSWIGRRGAQRMPCRVPVEVARGGTVVQATAVDLSRTGLRLQIALEALRLPPLPSLSHVALRLSQVFPEQSPMTLHCSQGLPPLSRHVRLVRIARPLSAGQQVEVGGVFSEPLSPAELEALGVSDPGATAPLDDGVQARGAAREAEFDPLAGSVLDTPDLPDVDEQRLTYVIAHGQGRRRGIEAYTETVTPHGVLVRVPDVRKLDLPADAADVSSRVMAFTRVYGSDVTLRLMDGDRQLWTGPARLENAEAIPGHPRLLRLGFAFTRDLGRDERRALLSA